MKLAASKVHFIGIGGIGMCGLAELLHNMGAQVTGSDLSDNSQTQRLRSLGINIFKGHEADNLGDSEVVVYSSAVKGGNVEFQEARRRKIPLIPRAEALAEMMRLKRGIAIAGTHGKTTTTSLTSSMFLSAGADPTIVIGGRLDVIKSTAQLGKGEWLIAEADESDGSFNRLSPEIVIITNIDTDHLDHYRDFRTLQNAFFDFASRIPFYGAAVVCGDDPEVRTVFESFSKKILYYGFDEQNDFVLRGTAGRYLLSQDGNGLGELSVPLPGQHNALNATAAVIAGMEAGLSFEQCAKGIAGFGGVDRRFQHKGRRGAIDYYDDYGHHPTEIKAVLSGFKESFAGREIVVLFQPHRYSRTALCWDEFLTCFNDADHLLLAEIYPAGEAPIADITSERLCQAVQHPRCELVQLGEAHDDKIRSALKPGSVFVTLGAGDVWRHGERIFSGLEGE